MRIVFAPETLMRNPETLRLTIAEGGARLRRAGLTVAAALLLSACSTMRGDHEIVASPEDVNWSAGQIAQLQAELDAAKAENTELTKRLGELEREAAEAKAAAAAKQAAAESDQRAESPTLARRPESVVAAADADNALAGSPTKPVEPTPRLVQPSFASERETVFENEAGDIRLASVLYGVHLASYRKSDEARAGWRQLQRDNPDELGLLEPRVEQVTLEDRGEFLRLIAGGFSSSEKASALCGRLKAKGVYCAVTGFVGVKLSGAETG